MQWVAQCPGCAVEGVAAPRPDVASHRVREGGGRRVGGALDGALVARGGNSLGHRTDHPACLGDDQPLRLRPGRAVTAAVGGPGGPVNKATAVPFRQ